MDSFSISELQQFSGIKAHTIRIWEQRYNALKPNRTEGNTRYYDNTQLRRLLNIVSLIDTDYKISELCQMSDSELFQLIERKLKIIADNAHPYEQFISQMISAGMEYDDIYFEKLFATCTLRFGLKETYTQIIYPLISRLGIMWAGNMLPPGQEHFISNLIKQKLYTAIDGLASAKPSADTWLLFLPENEFHEIGLLFSNYIIRNAGKKVIYLGANIPFESLQNAINSISPKHLLFFLVHKDIPEASTKYIQLLKRSFKKCQIHLSGNTALINELKPSKEIKWIKSVEELENILR